MKEKLCVIFTDITYMYYDFENDSKRVIKLKYIAHTYLEYKQIKKKRTEIMISFYKTTGL